MLIECWAIIGIVTAMSFIFLRAKKKEYAFAILPLTIVPLLHIISAPIAQYLNQQLSVDYFLVRLGCDLGALAAAGILFGFLSNFFEQKRSRIAYLIACGFFTVILTVILIFNLNR